MAETKARAWDSISSDSLFFLLPGNFLAFAHEYPSKDKEVEERVPSEPQVQWDLVDYGEGKFHVVSYQAEDSRLGAPETGERASAHAERDPVPLPDCFVYRCWSALRDGCGRAA
jgi:hypothetical protein